MTIYDDMTPEIRRQLWGWFGDPWNGCYTDDGRLDTDMEVPVPLGQKCVYCEDVFTETDSGQALPMLRTTAELASGISQQIGYQHRECFVRAIAGGLDHLAGRCSCCATPPDGLGSLSDGMSRHQEAIAVDEYVARHGC